MNNPSPLIPQGSLLEQKNKGRARVRLAVFFVLSIHVVGLMALLMQGCRRETPADNEANFDTNNIPAVPEFEQPTNYPPMTNAESNVPPSTSSGVLPGNPPPTNTYVPPMVEPQTTPAPVAPSGAQEYAIKSGDTFSSIAKNFGVSVKAIEEANPNVNPLRLQVGQKIQIPAPAAAGTSNTATPAETNAGSGQQVYKVKSGDTLTKIAHDYGTTVKALRSENNLTTDRIKVGQILKIPAKAPAAAPMAPMTQPSGTNQQ